MPAFTLGTVGCGSACTCSAPPCETNCPSACSPCPLPTHDLRASVSVLTYTVGPTSPVTVSGAVDAFGFCDLVYNGTDEWASGTIIYSTSPDVGNPFYEPSIGGCTFEYTFTVKCDGGTIKLFYDYVGGTCTGQKSSQGQPDYEPFTSGETTLDTSPGFTRSCLPLNVRFSYDFGTSTGSPRGGGNVWDVCPPVNAGCCPVEFTVVDCFGDPISGATVEVTDSFGNPYPQNVRATGTTNGSGIVTLDVLQAGTYTITVGASGFTPMEVALSCEGAYELSPDECCIVTFTVVDCEGDPISGVLVEVRDVDTFDLIASGTTDGSGVVVLNILEAGTYTVTVDDPDFSPRELELACDGEYTLEPDPENCGVPCEICVLPTANLNYSYTSGGVGTGTGTMTFDGVDTWESGCITETLSGGPFFFTIALICTGDTMVAQLRRYTASGCATFNASCASDQSNPNRLVFDSSTDDCDPVYLRWTLDGTTCSSLGGFPAAFSEIEVYE